MALHSSESPLSRCALSKMKVAVVVCLFAMMALSTAKMARYVFTQITATAVPRYCMYPHQIIFMIDPQPLSHAMQCLLENVVRAM